MWGLMFTVRTPHNSSVEAASVFVFKVGEARRSVPCHGIGDTGKPGWPILNVKSNSESCPADQRI